MLKLQSSKLRLNESLRRAKLRVIIRNKKQEWTKKWINFRSISPQTTFKRPLNFKKRSQLTKNSLKLDFPRLRLKFTPPKCSNRHLLSPKSPSTTSPRTNCLNWARVSKNWTTTCNLKRSLKPSLRQPSKFPKSFNKGISLSGSTQTKNQDSLLNHYKRTTKINLEKPLKVLFKTLSRRRSTAKSYRSRRSKKI